MTGINSIGSDLVQGFLNFGSKPELSTQNMFQMFSIELGGDGETITKDQLDSFIEDAKDGTVDVNDTELGSFIKIQQNWNDIFSGKNSITFSDMSAYTSLLVETVVGGISPVTASDCDCSNLTSLLNSLFSEEADDEGNSNSNLIETLTNLIAVYSLVPIVDI